MFRLAEAKDLVLTIAPELRDAPLYIIRQPRDLPAPQDGCRGFATDRITACQRESLIQAGLWQGRGRLIVVVDDDPANLRELIAHECTHLLPACHIPPIDIRPLPEALQVSATAYQAWAAAPESPRERADFHGRDFVRLACHTWWRMALLGVVTKLNWAAGIQYDRSSFHEYLSALGDEPLKMQAATFAEIAATPEPAAFAKLADQDEASARAITQERERWDKLQIEREGSEKDVDQN